MAENKKFLDADGLKHFWEMCRLQSDEDFKTNLEIFEAMATVIEELKEKTGVEKLPDKKTILEIIQSVEEKAIITLYVNHTEGVIKYTTGDGTVKELPIIKLYNSTGNNEDGTMTQKAITEELNKKVGVTVKEDAHSLVFTI